MALHGFNGEQVDDEDGVGGEEKRSEVAVKTRIYINGWWPWQAGMIGF